MKLIFLLLAACGSAPHDPLPSACLVEITGSQAPTRCTGALIDSDVVLTAAHCLRGTGGRVRCGDSAWRAVAEARLTPDFPGVTDVDAWARGSWDANLGRDVALLRLVDVDTTAPLAPLRLETPRSGQHVRMGRHDDELFVSTAFTLDRFGALWAGSTQEHAQPGDSGGPLWEHDAIVGVASQARPDCAEPSEWANGACTIFATLAPAATWIADTRAEFATRRAEPAPPRTYPPLVYDPCAAHASRDACVADSRCGYCLDSCLWGDATGPVAPYSSRRIDAYCPQDAWQRP